MFHELLSRDRGDDCDTGQPHGVGSEAYLNSTSQGPTPEDARKDGQIHGRSRQLLKYQGELTLWCSGKHDGMKQILKTVGWDLAKDCSRFLNLLFLMPPCTGI